MSAHILPWPDAETVALREYVAGPESYTSMCKLLNERFHNHRTRSAVIGKAHRLGLGHSGIVKGGVPVGYKRPPRKPQAMRAVGTLGHPHAVRSTPFRLPAGPMKIDDRTSPLPDHGMCAWPDGQKVCAGRACVGAYCVEHAKLAYTRLPDEVRNRRFHGG